jgi:pimeloyl-ACP methyl ester carboxylesterase
MPGTRGRTVSFERDGLRFEATDDGPRDGEPVVLLHGWPGGRSTWDAVVPALAAAGLRAVAPDQRGYGTTARPQGAKAYVVDELVADTEALLDAAGIERAHVVGHDWGGAVAWALASRVPQRVASLVVLSTPHPAAMARALITSDQALRSAYVGAFQVPVLPERLLLAHGGALLAAVLRGSGLPDPWVQTYVGRQLDPGALGASLAWYRALRHQRAGEVGPIEAPTTYVWSNGDRALGRRAAELTAGHVSGPYRFEVLDGVSHWIPETEPGLVADLVTRSSRAHPVRAA